MRRMRLHTLAMFAVGLAVYVMRCDAMIMQCNVMRCNALFAIWFVCR